MRSEILSRRKKKLGLFFEVGSYIYNDESKYILALFCITSIFFVFGFFSVFKIALIFLFPVWVILALRIKSVFGSLLLMTLYTLPFSIPSKINTVLVIPSSKLLQTQSTSNSDYLLGYGLTLVNVFLVLTLIALGREIILIRKKIVFLFRSRIVMLTFLSVLLFFIFGLYGSLFNSPFSELSVVWLSQYAQGLLMSLFVLYFFINYKKQFHLIFTVFTFTITMQSLISFGQFLKQSNLGLPIEISRVSSVYYPNIDEISSIFRVSGTFHYHNQLALVILVLIIAVSTKILYERKISDLLSAIFGLVTIILTQSRSIWIAALFFSFFLFKSFKKKFLLVVNIIGIRRIFFLILIVVVGVSYILIPRLMLSLQLFNEGTGLSFRIQILTEAMEAIHLNPITGYGAGTNEFVLESLFPHGIVSIFPTAVHNAYLQLMIEVGLLGVFFFLFPFFLILRTLIVRKAYFKNHYEAARYRFMYLSGVITFSIYYLFHPHVGILEFCYLGIVLGFGLIGVYLSGNYEKN